MKGEVNAREADKLGREKYLHWEETVRQTDRSRDEPVNLLDKWQ